MFKKIIWTCAGLSLSLAAAATAQEKISTLPTQFTIRIENITKPDAFTASNGTKWSLGFSPGLAVIHNGNSPIFSPGKKDRGKGLEAQSEEGDPAMLAKSLDGAKGIRSVTIFNTPGGAMAPGPITPGGAYEVTVTALPGDRLTLTTMMGQSNDWFYAPAQSGIALFKGGKPVSGDITAEIILWDAGTEVNQEPGIGSDQGPRQKAPNTGEAENGVVRNVKDVSYGKAYTRVADVMRVTVTPAAAPGAM